VHFPVNFKLSRIHKNGLDCSVLEPNSSFVRINYLNNISLNLYHNVLSNIEDDNTASGWYKSVMLKCPCLLQCSVALALSWELMVNVRGVLWGHTAARVTSQVAFSVPILIRQFT
jgi:hypothetical protein